MPKLFAILAAQANDYGHVANDLPDTSDKISLSFEADVFFIYSAFCSRSMRYLSEEKYVSHLM